MSFESREPGTQDRILTFQVEWHSADGEWCISDAEGCEPTVLSGYTGEMEPRELHGDMIADMSAELDKRLKLQRELLDYRVIDFGVRGGLSESTASPQ